MKKIYRIKRKHKIILMAIIIVIVSLLSYFFQQVWVLLFYSTIISLFPTEIKEFFEIITDKSDIRISYSYIFRIAINNCYLLVKDEQGRNHYHPVGGVYKYDPEQLDISEKFDGRYDGLFNSTSDTQDDLRLVIKKDKLKKFKKWFSQKTERENLSDLSREFKEELIDRKILPPDVFNNIKYKYLGSITKKSHNETLKIKQIRHYDIFDIKLTKSQKDYLRNLNGPPHPLYLFATDSNIELGHIDSGGQRYEIAEYTKMIIIGNREYLKEFDDDTVYNVKTVNKF